MVIANNRVTFSDGVTLELRGVSIPEGEVILTQEEEERIFWALIDLARAHLDWETAQEAVKAFGREIRLLKEEEQRLRARSDEILKRLGGAVNSLAVVL